MTNNSYPTVSIGLPVFNGDRYLQLALDSLLSQSYGDFELIISDNSSTDDTPLICKAYAEKDERITYHRFAQNVGAADNYNYVFQASRGKYFKWAAHDDLCAPEFLSQCIEALDADSSAVLAYPRVTIINADGQRLREYDEDRPLASDSPYERFASLLSSDECNAVFGLIRSHILAKTPLIGSYISSDLNLLAELALWGRFCEVSEHLFFRREHEQRPLYLAKNDTELVSWFDPRKEKRIVLPRWRNHAEYLKCVFRTPIKVTEKIKCCNAVAKDMRWNRRKLLQELTTALYRPSR